MASKVIDYELAKGPQDITGLEAYQKVFLLIRWRGRPIGRIWLPVEGEMLPASRLWAAASALYGGAIAKSKVEDLLGWRIPARGAASQNPTSSVAVCTKDRTEDLRRCLAALYKLTPPPTEILVIDNTPSDERTFELCKEFPVRYFREEQKGLNWARNRAAAEAIGHIIAYTDDDAVPDKGWLEALLQPFSDPSVSCVTGLVMPLELETSGQELFEEISSFCRGFERKVHDVTNRSPLGAAHAGAGAAMALRRNLVNELGLFRADLDAGTAARAGGDVYAFYRLLSLGHRIVYTPDALTWHRHRRTFLEVKQVLRSYTLATYVYLLRCLFLHGETSAIAVGLDWFKHHHLGNLIGRVRGHKSQPISITLGEIAGMFASPVAFLRTLRRERRMLRSLALDDQVARVEL